MKILIVDDEILIRTVIKEYCENNNFKTDEASNGKEALKKILENHYDLLNYFYMLVFNTRFKRLIIFLIIWTFYIYVHF